jgi:putative oxidoreductase
MALIPQMQMGVDALLFCFAFLYIASQGAGIWSVDAAMNRSGARP